MLQREIKVYLTEKGVTIVDPGYDCLPFIKKITPNFEIGSVPPQPGFIPSFQKIRNLRISGFALGDILRIGTEKIWEMHDRVIKNEYEPSTNPKNPTLLDLKIELTRREIGHCTLTGWGCGVDRFKQHGRCGLMDEAYYNSLYIHVAEESVITPTAVIKLSGCALRCIFCQAHEAFNIDKGKRLDSGVWKELEKDPNYGKAVTLEFVGGNPDESIYSILKVINGAPESFRLPIIWNNHGYGNENVYKLLNKVVDLYLTDFKYGNDECGLALSGVRDYWSHATEGIEQIIGQDSKAVIRILLLPGHMYCCHRKVMEWLSNYKQRIWVSVIDNYIPDWKALGDTKINRMVSEEEISQAKEFLKKYGLRDISDCPQDFWEKIE